MVKLSRQEIEDNINLEGIDSVDTLVEISTEISEYRKRLEDRKSQSLESIEDASPKFIEVTSKNGKVNRREVVSYDKKHNIAKIHFLTSDDEHKYQFYDMSETKPKLIATTKNTEHKGGLFITYGMEGSNIFKLNDKKSLQHIALTASGQVSLLGDGLYVVRNSDSTVVYSTAEEKVFPLLTSERTVSVSYDENEKVLGLSREHNISDDGEQWQQTTDYYRVYNNKVAYMGEHIEDKFAEDEYNNDYDDDNEWMPDFKIGKYEIHKSNDWQKNRSDDTWRSYIVARDTETDKYSNVYTCYTHSMDVEKCNNHLQIKDYDAGKIIIADIKEDERGLKLNCLSEEKMSAEEQFKNRYGVKTKYGTFYSEHEHQVANFVDNQGNVNGMNKDLYYQGRDRTYVSAITNNAMVNVSWSSRMVDGVSSDKYVYDFGNKCVRKDIEEVEDLGYDFFAAKKKGEEKFGIYEINDEGLKTPLLEVDSVGLCASGSYSGELRDNAHHIVYINEDVIYKAEMTKEGKIVPVAKIKDGKLSISIGQKWVPINFNNNIEVNLSTGDNIRLSEYAEVKGIKRLIKETFLNNKQLLKLAEKQENIQQKETVAKVRESYRNAKERLISKRDKKLGQENRSLSAEEIMQRKLSEEMIAGK